MQSFNLGKCLTLLCSSYIVSYILVRIYSGIIFTLNFLCNIFFDANINYFISFIYKLIIFNHTFFTVVTFDN